MIPAVEFSDLDSQAGRFEIEIHSHLGIKMFHLGILPPAQLMHRHETGPVDLLGTGRLDGVHETFPVGEFLGAAVFPEVGDRLRRGRGGDEEKGKEEIGVRWI